MKEMLKNVKYYVAVLFAVGLVLVSLIAESKAQQTQLQISLPANATGRTGGTVLIPIILNNPSRTPISAFSVEVSFNSNVLELNTNPLSTEGTLSNAGSGSGCFGANNTSVSGNRTSITYAAGCLRSITAASGTLFNLRMNVVGTINTSAATTTLEFTVRTGQNAIPLFENEKGLIPVTTQNGLFTVSAALSSVNLAGRVLTSNNRGLSGTLVKLTAADGSIKTVVTSSFGYFRFINVPASQTATIQILSKKNSFQPQTIDLTRDVLDLSFVANP